MAHRTYRYFTSEALFPFGYGLIYTKFAYGKPQFSATRVRPGDVLHIRLPVRNTGDRDGDEVVQVYVKHLKSSVSQPIRSLCAFRRLSIPTGKTETAALDVGPQQFRY